VGYNATQCNIVPDAAPRQDTYNSNSVSIQHFLFREHGEESYVGTHIQDCDERYGYPYSPGQSPVIDQCILC